MGTYSSEIIQNQCQGTGFGASTTNRFCLFNQTTNIIISFIAAKSVVEGQMTLGMMMSLTYIIGQLNSPISAFIGFARQLQDAKISLERLNEIHERKDEEQDITSKQQILPIQKNITINHVSFSYSGSDRDYVLDDICLNIPERKLLPLLVPVEAEKRHW